MGNRIPPAFVSGLKAGLAAPLALYAPPVIYIVPTQAYSAAAAFGVVGALMSGNVAAAKSAKDAK